MRRTVLSIVMPTLSVIVSCAIIVVVEHVQPAESTASRPYGRRLLCVGTNCNSTTTSTSLESAQDSSKMNTTAKAVAITLGCAATVLLIAVLAVVLIKQHHRRRRSSINTEESKYPVEDARASYRIKYRKNSMRGMAFSIRNATQLLQSEGYLQSPEYMQSKSCPTAEVRDTVVNSGTPEALLFLTNIAARLKAQGAALLQEIETHGYSDEYAALQEVGRNQPATASSSGINMLKNRYENVVAYDHSRVVLPVVNDNPTTDYINANWIHGFEAGQRFIATQGPNQHSMISFWRMVWYCDVRLVVMVTSEWEGGRLKCDRYWPEDGVTRTFGTDLAVEHVETQHHEHWIIRRFVVTMIAKNPGAFSLQSPRISVTASSAECRQVGERGCYCSLVGAYTYAHTYKHTHTLMHTATILVTVAVTLGHSHMVSSVAVMGGNVFISP
eukprot:m.1041787 g.1041787  ORF g.1041787 m.1041787 type:complete len:442 (-) comp24161_c3_seq2:999-2324(-)